MRIFGLIILTLASLTSLTSAFAREGGCQLVTDAPYQSLKSGLTPLWAQETIGADLAKEELKGNPSLYLTRVANFDGGFSGKDLLGRVHHNALSRFQNTNNNTNWITHGTKSSNNINSPEFGVAAHAELTHLYDAHSHKIATVTNAFLSNDPADILNLEYHTLCILNFKSICKTLGIRYGGLQAVRSSLAKLSGRTLIVASAGNFSATYPSYVNWPMITVGSVQPDGDISDFSNRSIDVSIVAPSHNHLYSYGLNGENTFGGTSGAAPLVTGAIANLYSILGKTNYSTTKAYLAATSVKLDIHKQLPEVHGVGMINAYKLVKLAQLGNIETETLAQLEKDSRGLLETAKINLTSNSCEDQQSAFIDLRKSFLLEQTQEAAELLHHIYTDAGFFENASFYTQWM